MKTKIISLAFMLVFAFSTSAFADGEVGQVGLTQDQPAATSTSGSFFTQLFDAFYH